MHVNSLSSYPCPVSPWSSLSLPWCGLVIGITANEDFSTLSFESYPSKSILSTGSVNGTSLNSYCILHRISAGDTNLGPKITRLPLQRYFISMASQNRLLLLLLNKWGDQDGTKKKILLKYQVIKSHHRYLSKPMDFSNETSPSYNVGWRKCEKQNSSFPLVWFGGTVCQWDMVVFELQIQ